MQQTRRLLVAVLVCAMLLAGVPLVGAQGGQTTYTVQAGDNLTRIAERFNTTVAALAQANNITNPNVVVLGQVLIIPAPGSSAAVTPAATAPATPAPAPTGDIVVTVKPGENLFRIALRYGLSAQVVADYNGITNPNTIVVGQTIRIPSATSAAAQAPAATAPAAPATEPQPAEAERPVSTVSNVGFAYGVQIHLPNQDASVVMQRAGALGVEWVKQEIDWALYEPTQGAINWEPIDLMVETMDSSGFKILLTVTSAPEWARDSSEEKGPPADYNTYAAFVGAMAARYAGTVDAYEIWSEPNLRREWNTPKGRSAASYVELLRLAYTAIKNADSGAVVVTAGLSPTGINDNINAIDDRVFLRQMYAAGVADWSDAIGAHPNGFGNPPDSTCCRNNRPAVNGWDDHPSFFFKQTLQDYREIMVQNGDAGKFLWVTEFGWGSVDGLGGIRPDPSLYGFVEYTSVDEQAQYMVRAFQIGQESNYVGPMFAWNLNFCAAAGVDNEQCFWSLLDPVNNPRPAYLVLQDIINE